MDRRKSIKTLIIGTVSAGALAESCNTGEKPAAAATDTTASAEKALNPSGYNRMKEELEYMKDLSAKSFFTPEELTTITILGDIIIPRDEVSGSASDAKVPQFIEFIVKDIPKHQIPMRGGLRWLDMQCLNRFGKPFKDCTQPQQIEVVNDIAYPKKAKPEMAQGVAFFTLMRNLTATGFYTSEMGVKDIGYLGNVPTQWKGVPDDVLKQYGLAYTDKELKECI
ncbi:MAG TPA: gluconate 2-dehydrogenase subunit 3 family protein [Puia sp.]|jgi:gluconate 2-dehydrogenase gamma chain|nr:gluconate 2-dehydrogenase subunit 3 family protein [Puia sp.]